MYAIDLHVHTKRYSPCAEFLLPEKIPEAMERKGLHGVVISEHDQLWPMEDIDMLNSNLTGRKIYRGVEVSTLQGHMVAIGLDDMNGLGKGVDAKILVQKARRENAAIILVHPFTTYPSMLSNVGDPLPFTYLDAIEVASSITTGRERRLAVQLAKEKGLKQVAGSDAHSIDIIGMTSTGFKALPENEKALAEIIRHGTTVAMVGSERGQKIMRCKIKRN